MERRKDRWKGGRIDGKKEGRKEREKRKREEVKSYCTD